jgi:hypothetical protein
VGIKGKSQSRFQEKAKVDFSGVPPDKFKKLGLRIECRSPAAKTSQFKLKV